MSPRKKPDKKVEAQDAPLSSINIANTLVDASGKDDISHYPEVQQNEYTATQAIYPDEFVRIRGRKDAWKNQENLAFRFRVNSFENPAFYVKLDVEFSLDYPKVPLKANIVALEPDSPKLRNELASTIKSIAKTHLNSECVYEVTSAVEDFLNNTARSKAEKVNPFSLEEERARREAAAKLLLKQTEDQSRQQQEDLHATGRRELLSQISSERQQHEGNPLDGTLSNLDPMPLPEFDFERKLTVRVPSTGQTIAFEKVEQRRVELKRDDKIIRLVSPLVEVAAEELPFLVLKEIILDQDLLPPSQMAATMRGIEEMLTKASKRHHKHVADIIAYKITYPHQSKEKKYELWILTDWAASGSLHRHLCISPVVFQERVREFTRQILDALAFYESHKFIHPAIHSGNVLLYMPSHENEPTIKLSDGYGTALRSLVDKAREKSSRLPSLPPQWLAPELRDQVGDQVQATALWNLGVIVLQMTLGLAVSTRYASPQECLRKEHFTGDFEDFLCALFQSNPKSRTSADILTAHAFLFKKGPLLKFPSAAVGQPVFQQNSSYSRWKNEWEQASLAGSGGFGTVYKVRKVADQIIYAVKRLKVNKKQPLDPMEYRKEVMNLARLQHPAVVRYYDAWTENFSEEFDQLTDSSSDAPIDEPPASMNVNNEEAMSQMLYDSLMANQGKSIVERLKFKHSFGRPGRGPEQVQSDESDDDESSEGQFDNDDDYDNAFQNGDAHVDNKDLAPAGFSTADRNSSAAITDESNDKPSSNPLNSDKYQQQFARLVRRRPSTVHTGEFYIQMEYCDGQDLKTLIANHLCNDVDSVWRISRGILDGLAYIHQQGVTHRDLKPANIFIGSNGAPKIGDFGLATAIPAREKGGSEVGSPFYMAPEVMSTEPIKNLQKTDMYSLGVIFFEMNTYFGTTTERNGVLTRLGKDPDSITATLGAEGKNAKQIAIIRPLLDHDPDKRPSAAQLLDSGLIPEPMEQEKLDRQLEYIVHNQPERLNTMLTIIENSDVQDLAWDFTAKQEVDSEETTLTAMPSLLLDDTRDRLRRIFSKHGAVESKRQALIPKTRFPAKDAMIVFNSAAMNFQLVQDVTTPFARSVAKQKPRFSKYYSFESSFQLRDESSKSIEPQQTLEANFDYISYKSTDLALKEASTIYLVKEIIAEFPALASGEWFVMINHMDLLDIVLDACNIRPADQFKVKDALASLSYGGMSTKQRRTYWDAVEKLLRKELEIDATAIAFLGKFAYLSAPPDQVRQLLETKLGKTSIGFPRALLLLRRLEETITYLDRLNFGMDIKIAPLFNFRPRLYDGSIAFQCVEKRSGSVLAQGGRYDNLIKYHQRASEDPPVRGVGLRVGLEDLVAITNNLASKKPAAASAVPSRCSVLVTSFDPEQLATSCLDVLQKIWAAGVSAELTEEVESMEALEAMHADDGAFWLVIVRAGLEGSLLIKVRSPSGGEETVGLEEVGEFLRVEVAREKKRA